MKKSIITMTFLALLIGGSAYGQSDSKMTPDGDLITRDTTLACQTLWTYEAKEDITAYEVARIMTFMFTYQTRFQGSGNVGNLEQDIKDLGTASRHFTKVECQ